ncbi:hypothetical protein E2320_008495 [Naja naja]|nr:hypothetical protein E2320_008495 [Naja naja]
MTDARSSFGVVAGLQLRSADGGFNAVLMQTAAAMTRDGSGDDSEGRGTSGGYIRPMDGHWKCYKMNKKGIFEQFVKTRIREEYKEKKNKLLLAKEEFKKLLEESKLSPRTTFKEFAEKYGTDQRFRLVQKKKDQEHFFNQFILILKKRDKENRIRLRKMR